MDPRILEVLEGRQRWVLLNEDGLKHLPQLPPRSVDHFIVDPAYSEHVHGKQRRILTGGGGRKGRDGRPRGKIREAELGFEPLKARERRLMARECARLVNRWCLIFSDSEGQHLWQRDLEKAGLKHFRFATWVKLNPRPHLRGDGPGVGTEAIEVAHRKGKSVWNSGGKAGVYCHAVATDRNQTGERFHPSQKPLSLMLELISDFTSPGDLIVDFCAGSGTTIVAALRLGRRCIAFEKDKEHDWFEKATRRCEAEAIGLSLPAYEAGQLPMF